MAAIRVSFARHQHASACSSVFVRPPCSRSTLFASKASIGLLDTLRYCISVVSPLPRSKHIQRSHAQSASPFMLSRRSTRSTQQLRKARSSDAKGLRHERRARTTGSEAAGARPHALTAAEIAFNREYGLTGRGQLLASPRSSNESPSVLRRTQSVRFAGPSAVPPRSASIRRREASARNGSESRCINSALSCGEPLSRPDTALTALPQARASPGPPESRGSSLRKAKSLFIARDLDSRPGAEDDPGRIATYAHGVALQESYAYSPGIVVSSKLGIDLASTPIPEHDEEGLPTPVPFGMRKSAQARDLRKQASMPAFTRRRQSPKPFRRTVRSSSTTSYGDGISSHPNVHPPATRVATIGLRVRHMSSSVKGKVKRAFRRASGSSDSVPKQQVGASKSHFVEDAQDLACDGVYPFIPMPEEELVSRCSSRTTSPMGMPAPFNPTLHPGSVRTTLSVNTDGSKSRVTSWANSTVADGTQRMNAAEIKRLSVIQENGGPHQPSSSAGAVGLGSRGKRVHELFRRPLRPGTGRMNEPVDPHAIYSALQQRLEEIRFEQKERRRQDDGSDASPRRASGETTTTQAARNPSGGSNDTCRTTVRLIGDSSSVDDDTTGHNDSSEAESSKDGRRASAAAEQVSGLYSFSASTESLQPPPQAPELRSSDAFAKKLVVERGSTFFPNHQDVQQQELSPYRRAMLARIAEEDSRATVYDPALIAPNLLSSGLGIMANRNGSGQSVSESNYSRGVGGTPTTAKHHSRPFSYEGRGPSHATGRPESTSSSEERTGSGNWTRVTRPCEPSRWTNNGWFQHDPREGLHVREQAQYHEDETDRAARACSKNPEAPPTVADDTGPTSTIRAHGVTPWPERKSSRRPLQERDAGHAQNVQNGSPAPMEDYAHTPSTANYENRRLSSYQLHAPHTPQPLSQKASIASFASRRSVGPNAADGGAAAARPASLNSRHSPERIARLRRLQSSHALRPRMAFETNEPAANVHEYFAQAKHGGYPRMGSSSPFRRGTPDGRYTPGGSRMVEEFLERRRERHASEQSNGPVFL